MKQSVSMRCSRASSCLSLTGGRGKSMRPSKTPSNGSNSMEHISFIENDEVTSQCSQNLDQQSSGHSRNYVSARELIRLLKGPQKNNILKFATVLMIISVGHGARSLPGGTVNAIQGRIAKEFKKLGQDPDKIGRQIRAAPLDMLGEYESRNGRGRVMGTSRLMETEGSLAIGKGNSRMSERLVYRIYRDAETCLDGNDWGDYVAFFKNSRGWYILLFFCDSENENKATVSWYSVYNGDSRGSFFYTKIEHNPKPVVPRNPRKTRDGAVGMPRHEPWVHVGCKREKFPDKESVTSRGILYHTSIGSVKSIYRGNSVKPDIGRSLDATLTFSGNECAGCSVKKTDLIRRHIGGFGACYKITNANKFDKDNLSMFYNVEEPKIRLS